MPEPQLLSVQPLRLLPSPAPKPLGPWTFIQPGSVCLYCSPRWRRGEGGRS